MELNLIPYYSRQTIAPEETYYIGGNKTETKSLLYRKLPEDLSEMKLSLKDPNYSTRYLNLIKMENFIIYNRPLMGELFKDKNYALDFKSIIDYLTSEGKYDYNYQDMIGYLIDSMISIYYKCPEDIFLKYITDIDTIKYGPNTNVFLLKHINDPLFIVKTSHKEDEMSHEAIIGIYALNKLRSKIPNFMHTYGTYISSIPVIDDKNHVILWCKSSVNLITHIVLENINDGINLKDMAPTITSEIFLNIYLQVLNAINVAYKDCDFTHYDLHPGNIIVQKLDKYIDIPLYNKDGSITYLKTCYLARIIDYGLSHAYIDGIHFGNYSYRNHNIDGESSFPIYDAYKLLLATYLYSVTHFGNLKDYSEISSVVACIYYFFSEGKTADLRIAQMNETYESAKTKKRRFSLYTKYLNSIGIHETEEEHNKKHIKYLTSCLNEEEFQYAHSSKDNFQASLIHKKLSLDNLISYILDKFKLSFNDGINPIIETDPKECIHKIVNNVKIKDSLDFYIQSRKDNHQDVKNWLETFDYREAYSCEIELIKLSLNNISNKLSRINICNMTEDKILYEDYHEYLKNLQKLVKCIAGFSHIKDWMNTVKYSSLNQKIPQIIKDLVNLKWRTTKIKSKFLNFGKIITKNRTNNMHLQAIEKEQLYILLEDIILEKYRILTKK